MNYHVNQLCQEEKLVMYFLSSNQLSYLVHKMHKMKKSFKKNPRKKVSFKHAKKL